MIGSSFYTQDDPIIMFENTVDPDRSEVLSHITEFYVDLDSLVVIYHDGNPLNPRGEIHDSRWLQSSLVEEGQKQAIEVVPTTDGRFVVEDGHTRIVAARALGWKTLRAKHPQWWDSKKVDIESLDKNQFLMHMLAHNVRRDIPPSRQGKAFVTLINAEFLTIERLAARMGMDVPVVQDYINLAAAPESIQRRVDNGEMAWTAFKEWRKKSEKVKQAIAESNDPKDFSVRGLRDKAREVRTGEPKTAKMSVIEDVVATNEVNPLVAALKAAVMAVIANWYELTPAEQEEIMFSSLNLNELMEQN